MKIISDANQAVEPVEIWAGIECTVNRVGDSYFHQMKRNGHEHRISDLETIADLGITKLRYPVLWELTAPEGVEKADWSWPDERLSRLRGLGVQPIAGLLHHGSGPRYTSLVDPEFPEKLADYAAAVAARYPWLTLYTPVNEPLTTARFSALYGHWYPHGRNLRTFAQALLNECRGTVLAMRRIREIQPEAKLVQTDDLGKIYSTPLLQYQADLENERRWLSFDLLCGQLTPDKPMWNYLVQGGTPESELAWFLDNPLPPDIIGINHYLSSNRYLDENLDCYPEHIHGGNEIHRYADIEAARACPDACAGYYELLTETWERYHLPIAVTEAHMGCTREEQLRWLHDAWKAVNQLKAEGKDIRGLTVWSLLGAFDWNVLVTRDNGFYEPGVFDIRGDRLRPTALAKMVKALATEKSYHHPLVDMEGWWQRDDRLRFPEPVPGQCFALPLTENCEVTGACGITKRPLLIIGARGTLGQAFARICDIRGIPYYLLSRQHLDISDYSDIAKRIPELQPWAVVNAAGYVRVDDAEQQRHLCWLGNVVGPANLAAICAELDIPFVTFSSDLVFDGANNRPYIESDTVAPMSVYGETKAEAERRVLQHMPSSLIIRTSSFFGPWDRHNFVTKTLEALARGEAVRAAEDMIVSPTYVPDLVNAALDLLIDEAAGIWHITNPSEVSWADLARMAARAKGHDVGLIEGLPAKALALPAIRPSYSALGTERGLLIPELEAAMSRYFNEAVLSA